MAKVTKATVDTLRPKRREDGSLADGYLWDDELKGFGCKVTPAGRKVYLVQYRINGRAGKTQRVTLGIHGKLAPDQARRQAKAVLGKIADGINPAEERRERKRRLATGYFKDVCEQYLEANGQKNKSWPETERLLKYDAIPALGNRPMTSITRGDVMALIDAVRSRSHSVARALFAALRPLFRWALDRDIIETNPIANLKGPAPLASRKRALDADEIRALWKATHVLGWPFGPLYRVLLLTGQRKEEVAGMRWEEINLEKGIWRLPPKEEFEPQRTKNGEEHIVDLSPQALAILRGLPGERDGLVFTTTGATPVSGFSKAKSRIDELMAQDLGRKLKPWRNHDLRRTVATLMGEEEAEEDEDVDASALPTGIEADTEVIERILNHLSGSQGGLRGIYQRQKYRRKRKRTLLAWGDYVERLVADADAGSTTSDSQCRPVLTAPPVTGTEMKHPAHG